MNRAALVLAIAVLGGCSGSGEMQTADGGADADANGGDSWVRPTLGGNYLAVDNTDDGSVASVSISEPMSIDGATRRAMTFSGGEFDQCVFDLESETITPTQTSATVAYLSRMLQCPSDTIDASTGNAHIRRSGIVALDLNDDLSVTINVQRDGIQVSSAFLEATRIH